MFKKFLFAAMISSTMVFASAVTEVGEQDFNREIQSGTVVVDFYGPWCGPCKKLSPVLDAVADETGDKVKFIKVNIDKAHTLTQKYDIDGVPTLILFENGKEKGRKVGYQDKSSLKKFIGK